MKAIKFKERDEYSIELSNGLYLIDGNPIHIERYSKKKVQVKDIHNVIPITRSTIVDYYLNDEKVTMDVTTYKKQKDKLLQKGKEVEYEEGIEWDSLEDEFNYRKFQQTWKPVLKSIEIKGDPYTFEIVESKINTGNPFIASDYVNGGVNPLLFTYNRPVALLSIVSNKFKELGMEFKNNIDYSNTSGNKVWGNSTHSGIRYVTAFGTYIFNDTWKISNIQRGNLDTLLAQYDKDKDALEKIIQTKYNVHFGKIDLEGFDFDRLLSTLKHANNLLDSIEYKTKSRITWLNTKSKLNEGIKFIENNYKIK